ncbi:MAG: hypothetical protein WDO69_24180 [Pseudomonadota bacterium]
MSTFIFVHLIHVMSAVFAGGLVAAVAVVAGRSATDSSLTNRLLLRLTRGASLGLGATFLTGIGLDLVVGGALHERWWFRLAGISMIAAGALIATVRRRLSRVASGAVGQTALLAVPWLAYAACAVVAWITVLMELQPF